MIVRKHPGADEDLADGFRWYDAQQLGRGDAFLNAVADAFHVIARQPRSFTEIRVPAPGHEVRRYVVPKYPYSILYDIRPNDIVVIAVAHGRRQPMYWLNRLTP